MTKGRVQTMIVSIEEQSEESMELSTGNTRTHAFANYLLSPREPPTRRLWTDYAEKMRPWAPKSTLFEANESHPETPSALLYSTPLLRIFDDSSGSQPDKQLRMLARAPRMRLDTEEDRRNALSAHADHERRESTPFISFISCPKAAQELAEKRSSKGGRMSQMLVVVDPRTRLKLGLSILSCRDEMHFYGVRPPGRYMAGHWRDHYLCLWEVTPEEVVGIWRWDELRRDRDWYQRVLAALEQRQQNREQTKTRARSM